MDSDRKLVNFRVPEDLVEMFDESCQFKNRNRTQTLIDLKWGSGSNKHTRYGDLGVSNPTD